MSNVTQPEAVVLTSCCTLVTSCTVTPLAPLFSIVCCTSATRSTSDAVDSLLGDPPRTHTDRMLLPAGCDLCHDLTNPSRHDFQSLSLVYRYVNANR